MRSCLLRRLNSIFAQNLVSSSSTLSAGQRHASTASSRSKTPPTVRNLLSSVTEQLASAGIPEPELSCQHLLGRVLGRSRIFADEQPQVLDFELRPEQELALEGLVHCRLARMPIQYLVGNWDFRDITLDLRPPVFIPRPETEQLVEEVLSRLPPTPCSVLEVGPGSGAICLALLKARSDLRITAVEQSIAAVELTRHNAEKLGLQERLTLIQEKVGQVQLETTFDAVVSNPPYVLRKDLANLEPEIHVYEDLRALDGGAEGMDVILQVVELASQVLKKDGSAFVALEVDPCHPHILPPKLELFHSSEVIQDFRGIERFMLLKWKD